MERPVHLLNRSHLVSRMMIAQWLELSEPISLVLHVGLPWYEWPTTDWMRLFQRNALSVRFSTLFFWV